MQETDVAKAFVQNFERPLRFLSFYLLFSDLGCHVVPFSHSVRFGELRQSDDRVRRERHLPARKKEISEGLESVGLPVQY